MAQLVLTGQIHGQTTTQCNFTIAVNGGDQVGPDSVVLDQSIFNIPDTDASIDIQAAALDQTKYGTPTAHLDIDSSGTVQATFPPDGNWPPPAVTSSDSGQTIQLTVHFSPLRDVTEQARVSLAQTGSDYPGSPPAPPPGDMSFRTPGVALPPGAYSPPPGVTDSTFIASPSISGGAIQVETRSVTPGGEAVVLRLPGVDAPQLVAVYWPSGVSRDPGGPPAPFLVYFHPGMAQNSPAFYNEPRDRHDPTTGSTYPFGWDYQFFGLLNYLQYIGDPFLTNPFAKGLPLQIDGAARNVVLVLPLMRVAGNPCDEISSFADATVLQEYLPEIQALMFRRSGNFQFGPIGRLGMASFSSGHAALTCFLGNTANQAHPLYLDTLQEAYLFDPHADLVSETLAPLTQVTAWAGRGTSGTKTARLYTQNDPAQLSPLLTQLGVTAPGPAPFDAATPDDRNSLTSLPLAAWNTLATQQGSAVPYANTGQVHQVLPALMLTDALRRSRF
ncbi:hypothetical protein ACFVHI_22965 [Kitasatospora sp. NPDC127121]|uniref:hypothetical protein n=1 Tax=Kitasatospora sp. NPDC127121 TaxID=3345371 RepID=UPI003635F164